MTLLPVRFSPSKGEDFSSWLCRLSVGNGLRTSKMLRLLLDRPNVTPTINKIKFTPDIKTVNVLASAVGIPAANIRNSTFLREAGCRLSANRRAPAERILKEFLRSRRPYCPPVLHG